jgi:hypothetical protein
MKKVVIFLITVFLIYGLTSCKKEGVSLYEAVGIEIKNIESASCNTSIAQSWAWEFEAKYYKYLDVEYEITDFNINEKSIDASLIVYVETYDGDSTTFYFVNDYIYLENNETNTNYVSIKKTNIDYSKVWPK